MQGACTGGYKLYTSGQYAAVVGWKMGRGLVIMAGQPLASMEDE